MKEFYLNGEKGHTRTGPRRRRLAGLHHVSKRVGHDRLWSKRCTNTYLECILKTLWNHTSKRMVSQGSRT